MNETEYARMYLEQGNAMDRLGLENKVNESDVRLVVLIGVQSRPVNYDELKASLTWASSTISITGTRLLRGGYVEKKLGLKNQRKSDFTLTKKGRELYSATLAVLKKVNTQTESKQEPLTYDI